MSKISINTPIVSVQWLNHNLKEPNIIILDASIKNVTGDDVIQDNKQIPNTRFF